VKTPIMIRRAILTADLACIVVAMGLAYVLRYGWVWNGPDGGSALTFLPLLLVGLGLWSLMSAWLNLDGFRGGWYSPAVMSQLFLAVLGLMLMLLAVAFLRREYVSRLVLGYFGILLFAGFFMVRFSIRLHFGSLHRAGSVRRVVIVGSGALARELATKIERHPEMLYQVVGFLCPAEAAMENEAYGSDTVSTRTFGVVECLRPRNVDEVIIALPKPGHPEALDLAARCRAQGIAVSLVPHPYELYLSRTRLLDLDGLPLLQLQDAITAEDPAFQRFIDVVLASFLAILASPAVLLGAALLKYYRGRAFRRELRCGKKGAHFWMYRLNSEAYAQNLPRYEALLQHLSVTELPQLWNVLRGEMSLVGPRPEAPEKVKHYSDWQRQRLNAKPGITGLAQVHGLRDRHSSEDKARYDLQYMLNRSAFIDISLLLQTLWTLILRLLQLPKLKLRSDSPSEPHPELSFEESLRRAHSSQSSAD
jgi:lipopolysaccharide/colanic/teichoic acid biosynthesis glycosyltransferase